MGKRKERRLAAKIAAGRRVKLDIFAEPSSGNLGGSSAHEAGEDKDSKVNTGSPKSPSSSGEQPANPLSLLGQYSDDDLDEDSSDRPNNVDNSLVDIVEEAKETIGEDNEELGTSHDASSSQKVDELSPAEDSVAAGALQGSEDHKAEESHEASADAANQEVNLVMQNPVTVDTEAAKDEECCWKMVLHEESNHYYFWNTVTGETSWEVPDTLAGKAQHSIGEQEPLHAETKGNAEDIPLSKAEFYTQANNITSGHDIGCANLVSETRMQENAADMDLSTRECKGDGHMMDGSIGAGYVQQEAIVHENYSVCQQPGYMVVGDWSSMAAASAAYVNETMANAHDGATLNIPSRLVDLGESLLQRLKSLDMSEDSIQHACTLKLIVEIETRLSDMKSLLPYDTSLLPFWVHSERELRRLENTINTELVSYVESAQINVLIHEKSSEREGARQEHGGGKLEVDASMNQATISSDVSPDAGMSGVVLNASQKGSTSAEKVQGDDHPTQSSQQEYIEAKASAHAEDNIKYACQSSEDVDMDVDMEVEDTGFSSNMVTTTMLPEIAPAEQMLQNQNAKSQLPATGEELTATPTPPPDEEWIPPPPPDDEEIPPPPPEEPPETMNAISLSSYPDTMQSLSYTQGYSFTYPSSHYNYYGDTTIGTGGASFYGHAEGTQNIMHDPTVYYEALSNPHPEAPVIVANPVGSSVYYGIQDGRLSTEPVVAVQTNSFEAAAGPMTCNVPSSNPAKTVEPQAEVPALPHMVNSDNGALGSRTEVKASESFSHSFVVSAPANISTKESAPAASAASTVSSASATTAKPQLKVPRIKKRTVATAPSLRSNKRVSSLVDKWKAAKEELEEEEEKEPEDPLEILEKKRQREIEEWRAQQIASGEARNNANFQPVVGDWRERVKRRRAQKEATRASPDVTAEESKPPNLTELSRDLPPGWQAYWDESTKQAYYGNALTSETTWTKPTR